MTATEWKRQWTRLLSHFRLNPNADPAPIEREWFAHLKHHHVDAVEAGLSHLVGSATETHWPALGTLKQAIQAHLSKYEHTRAHCETCHGSGWVEAAPWRANGGHVYQGNERCPDCGIPAPEYKPLSTRTPLNAIELVAFDAGTLEQPRLTVQPNAAALEALRALTPHRGRLAKVKDIA